MNKDEKKKRKVDFSEVDEENKRSKNVTTDTRLHSGKYTLESDEEDEEEQAAGKEMNQDELEGLFKRTDREDRLGELFRYWTGTGDDWIR